VGTFDYYRRHNWFVIVFVSILMPAVHPRIAERHVAAEPRGPVQMSSQPIPATLLFLWGAAGAEV
jgi:hypothetical protein